jgi:WD40 repeat protein
MHSRARRPTASRPARISERRPNRFGPRVPKLFLASCAVLCGATRLLAADLPTAIFVMKTDGTAVRKVAQVDGYEKHGSPHWSHDGKRLAFDAYEGPADAKKFFVINIDGTGLVEMGEHAMPHWSPDDKQLAYQSYGNGTVRQGIWVQNIDGKGRNWLADGFSPRWSPDGSQIALVAGGRTLHVLDLLEGGERNLLDEPFDNVSGGFDWSPDGKWLAFMGDRNNRRELLIVSAAGASQSLKTRWSGDLSGSVAWSPDGKQLAFSLDQKIHLIDVDGGRRPTLIPGQEGSNREPAWSPDGQWLAFSSERKSGDAPQRPVAKRVPMKLEEVLRHPKGTDVYGVAFTPDGRRAVFGGSSHRAGIQVWDLAGGQVNDFNLPGVWLALSPDGRQFATCALSQKILLVDTETGKVTRELHPGDVSAALAYSPDGMRLVAGCLNKRAVVMNPQTGKEISTFKNHTDWVTRVVFSPDGKNVISVSHDKSLRVWDATTTTEILAIEHPEPVWGLAVSPDGGRILTGTGGSLVKRSDLILHPGSDNTLRLWNSANGQLIREMKGHSETVFTIDFSPDGLLAVSGGWDNTIRLWDLETGTELSRIDGSGGVMQVKFSPDGQQVLVAGGVIRTNVGRLRQVPNEQVRLYHLVENTEAGCAAPAQN